MNGFIRLAVEIVAIIAFAWVGWTTSYREQIVRLVPSIERLLPGSTQAADPSAGK